VLRARGHKGEQVAMQVAMGDKSAEPGNPAQKPATATVVTPPPIETAAAKPAPAAPAIVTVVIETTPDGAQVVAADDG